MATYVIGDVQGCFTELQQLIDLIQFDEACDKLIFVGDLVNRGPDSLKVLQWVFSNQHCTLTVLGNHDLHLIACWLGISSPKAGDTIDEVLASPDVDLLLNWLSKQPLIIESDGFNIVHAGVFPAWTIKKAKKLAQNALEKYSGTDKHYWFRSMYGNKPTTWASNLDDIAKFRFTINAFTRMRFCEEAGLDFKYKGELLGAPNSLKPWFAVKRKASAAPIVFGHWSALGLYKADNVIGIDTGVVWGGKLTALRLCDLATYQVQSKKVYQCIDV